VGVDGHFALLACLGLVIAWTVVGGHVFLGLHLRLSIRGGSSSSSSVFSRSRGGSGIAIGLRLSHRISLHFLHRFGFGGLALGLGRTCQVFFRHISSHNWLVSGFRHVCGLCVRQRSGRSEAMVKRQVRAQGSVNAIFKCEQKL
jgi:hypothetical protein